jgi:dTDP-4-amino-4,6-dideoxygalactose transaminase
MNRPVTRRHFLGAASATSVALGATVAPAANGKLALVGGTPVRAEPFPSWPKIGAVDEQAWMEVLHSGQWFRGRAGRYAKRFEESYAELMGSKYCLATANGTSALFASLNALDVGPGDEVLVPPYTFVATVNVVLLQHAIPVFVDTDPETFQIDASKIEAAITERTKAMIPVHLGGSAADMDAILALAKKRKVPVIEDACQAHLAEWRDRRVGSLGDTGCFSFQATKNLNSGEGGAILTGDDELIERCYTFHNNGRGRRTASYNFSYRKSGANLRMTQFQPALLVAQMTRLEEQSKTREQNAAYLTSMLREIPGIKPARMYEGCTRNAYHLYMFRYDKEAFAGASRNLFLKALRAEGIPCSGGYRPLNKEPFLKNTLSSRGYRVIYPRELLAEWEERTQCPANDCLCQEAVWFTQTMLLGSRRDMEQIAEAIRKIQARAAELRRA